MEKGANRSFAQAVRDGLAVSMAHDPSVFMMGEGIADPSGIFGTTTGLAEEFGAQRMVEMPVAENGLVGVAVGAALMGQRPVISLQRVEFALLAIEQIVNNAAKSHYVSNGQHQTPLVIRMIVGRGWGQGPEHSQSLEAMFALFPGLKVIMPAMPADAKGLTVGAIADNNPVIIIEHRWLHNSIGFVEEGYCAYPLDGPKVIRNGKDITIVATSYMTLEAIRAAEALAIIGVDVEVVDVRVLRPLNIEPIAASVEKTGRLMTVDTGWRTYGVGGEIVSSIVERCFDVLKCSPIRLGLPDHPTPSSRGFIPGHYPDARGIVKTTGDMLQIPVADIQNPMSRLEEEQMGQPIDTPDAYFKGPF